MKIIYRISDAGYNKIKPDYINNETCLRNALQVFPWSKYDWSIIADNISEETNNMIQKYITRDHILYVSVGHGAGTFNIALDEALQGVDDDVVYFLENDYLHKKQSDTILLEGYNGIIDHKYLFTNMGYNLKPLDMQGAIGIEQLKKIDEIDVKRRVNFARIKHLFEKYISGVRVAENLLLADPSWFGVPLITDTPELKEKLQAFCEENKIQTRNYFAGNILLHPGYHSGPAGQKIIAKNFYQTWLNHFK